MLEQPPQPPLPGSPLIKAMVALHQGDVVGCTALHVI